MIIVGLFAKWQPTTLFSDMYRIYYSNEYYDSPTTTRACLDDDVRDTTTTITIIIVDLLQKPSLNYSTHTVGTICLMWSQSIYPIILFTSCACIPLTSKQRLTVLGINSQQQTWTESSSSPPRRIVCHSFAHSQPIIIVSALISMAQQFLKRHSHRVYR